MTFASGKIALAICDKSLVEPIRDSNPTGLKACPDCFDPDHPQYRVGDLSISDAIGLDDPRPDKPRSDFTDTVDVPALSTIFLSQ